MENASEDIQRACRLGELSLLKEALQKCPDMINEKDLKLGWTGLYRSVICGHFDTSLFMLESGADPNIKTKMGDTALHQAADNRLYKLAELLIKYKADPDIQQNDGETPLHLSCFKGDFDMVKILLEAKSNPNIQNYTFGKTPIHYAVDYSYGNITSLLVQYGASLEVRDKHGKTAKDIARNSEIQNLLGNNSIYVPSPEPSYILENATFEKPSIGIVSPILSRSNSDISLTSDCRSVEIHVKQLEDIHKKIREKVRASVDTAKIYVPSHNTSSIFEPDAEKTVFDMFVGKDKIISFGGTERNPELYNWLTKIKLEEIYGLLISAGYDDLSQLTYQMTSSMPITENSLAEIGIRKQGHRKRFLIALDMLISKENLYKSQGKNPFTCCTANVPSNLWVLNVPSLETWLETLNLKEMFYKFIENGYDDLEDMIAIMNTAWEITAEDLKEIGIDKPGYRHRILSKLKEDSQSLPKLTYKKREVLIEKNSNSSVCESCVLF